jgi:hypothetical protein
VTSVPDGIDLERHRDSVGLGRVPIFRLVVLLGIVVLLALALANVLGQRPVADVAEGADARLEVSAPTAVRGGLFFQGRFRIEARRLIEHATLVLDRGWQEQLSINTIEPAPVGEASRDGRLALDFGAVQPGRSVVAYIQFQVNPAQFFARRSQDVVLADGERELLRIDRTLTYFP